MFRCSNSINREPALLLELLDGAFRSGAVASIDTAHIIADPNSLASAHDELEGR